MIEHIQQQLSVPRELHNQRVDSVLARLLLSIHALLSVTGLKQVLLPLIICLVNPKIKRWAVI